MLDERWMSAHGDRLRAVLRARGEGVKAAKLVSGWSRCSVSLESVRIATVACLYSCLKHLSILLGMVSTSVRRYSLVMSFSLTDIALLCILSALDSLLSVMALPL